MAQRQLPIAIIAVYTFIATWNNFMGPLIYVNDDRLFPLAMGLFKFDLRAGSDVGLMMAAAFIMHPADHPPVPVRPCSDGKGLPAAGRRPTGKASRAQAM